MALLWRVRVANTGLFLLTGLATALWVVNIPAVQEQAGVSKSVLGLLLLALGGGSIVGMQVAGWISDRYGSRPTAGLAVVIIALGINGPGWASSGWQLALLLPLLGLGTGTIIVAANDQAVKIEQAYGRPIMSAFHGYFSIAGALGAGLGAALHALDVPARGALAIASVAAVLIGLACVPRLLGAHEAARLAVPAPAEPVSGTEPSVLRPAVVLAVLSCLLSLAEGTATDWSVLHAVEHLGQSQTSAAFAYGTFALAMTIGRLSVDRVVAQAGPVLVVRWGSALAALGMLGVVLSPAYPLTLLAWLVFGLGLSGIVPQIFTAAGNLSLQRRGVILSRVVGLGYLGMLAGPALVGWLADLIGLNAALLAPMLCCLTGLVLAGAVRPRA
ncbi:MFS transporter [Kineosporia babensis]